MTIEDLYNKLLLFEGKKLSIPGTIFPATDNIAKFAVTLLNGNALDVDVNAGGVVLSTDKTTVTVTGKTKSYGFGDFDITLTFIMNMDQYVADLAISFGSEKLSLPGVNWFSLTNPGIEFTVSNGNLPVIGSVGGNVVVNEETVRLSMALPIANGFWSFKAAFRPILTIAEAFKFIGSVDIASKLQPPFKSIATTVGVKDVGFVCSLSPAKRLSTNVLIGTPKSWDGWTLAPGITITSANLSLTIDESNGVSYDVFGSITVGGIDIALFALNPGHDQGWTFLGQTEPGEQISINDLLSDICSLWNVTFPPRFPKMYFTNLSLSFDTKTGGFSFGGELDIKSTGSFSIAGKDFDIAFIVAVDYVKGNPKGTYQGALSGILNIGNSAFSVVYEFNQTNSKLIGSWKALNKDYLELADIASTFGFTPPAIPKGLDLSLKSASLTYDFTHNTLVLEAESVNYGNAVFVAYKNPATTNWQFYFGLSIDKPINLSNLPLINRVLSGDETIEIKNLQVLVSSDTLLASNPGDQQEITLINKLIGPGYPAIPEQGLPDTVALSAQFDFGGLVIPLSIGTPAKSMQSGQGDTSSTTPDGSSVGQSSGSGKGTIPQPTHSADGATWFDIQKNFGPVSFRKIGVKYENGVLWFLIDASLTAAGLQISVIGLSMGSPLTSFEPEFNIEGLGIDYSNTAVTIAGAFDKLPPKAPVTLEFAGSVCIQLKEVGLSAIGSYVQFDNQTSMFVFADVNGSFGGPGFFFITGFCGGFGYNSRLRIPGQDEVYQFPFVASMSNPAIFGNNPGPTAVLENLMGGDKPWVTPSAGDIWMSAGIKFTTYEVVNSTALVIAEFGNKFLLSLLGLSQARFPMEGSTVYAYVELQLEALFDPDDGVVSFTAVLSPNSFVLDPACHLTGGFALCYWFGTSPYAGDFVLTLGGYSPYFNPPVYYPQEPRLGFNWALDSSISISGSLYFALTPAAIMAGGSLNATYHSGNLKAWFDLYADIIIWYNPFHFIADIGLNIGASYKLDLLFCSKTFRVELGADLTLWAPATGGTVTVHWWVISFTIDFGAGLSSGLDKQSWSDFIKVLPAPNDVVKITPLTGLLGGPVPADRGSSEETTTLTAEETQKTAWIVRAGSFRFTTDSSVPLTELYIGSDQTPVKTGSALNIKPMQLTGLMAKKTLTIINKETNDNVLDTTWGIEFVTKNVPSALWGTGSSKELPGGGQLVEGQLAGFRIKVPSPVLGNGTGDINIKQDLRYDPLSPGANPLKLDLNPQGPVPATSDQTITAIEQIMSASVKNARDTIYNTFENLGLDGLNNTDLTDLATHANALFVDEPLLTN